MIRLAEWLRLNLQCWTPFGSARPQSQLHVRTNEYRNGWNEKMNFNFLLIFILDYILPLTRRSSTRRRIRSLSPRSDLPNQFVSCSFRVNSHAPLAFLFPFLFIRPSSRILFAPTGTGEEIFDIFFGGKTRWSKRNSGSELTSASIWFIAFAAPRSSHFVAQEWVEI